MSALFRFESCRRCLQYAEDCACCADCGGQEGDHHASCSEATTARFTTSAVVPCGDGPVLPPLPRLSTRTIRGLGSPSSEHTDVTPRARIVVDDACPMDLTGSARRIRP